MCVLSVLAPPRLGVPHRRTRLADTSFPLCAVPRIRRAGAFQLYDINNDGLITYDEMLKIVQSIYDMTGEMVKLPPDEDTAEKVRFRPMFIPFVLFSHPSSPGFPSSYALAFAACFSPFILTKSSLDPGSASTRSLP